MTLVEIVKVVMKKIVTMCTIYFLFCESDSDEEITVGFAYRSSTKKIKRSVNLDDSQTFFVSRICLVIVNIEHSNNNVYIFGM